MRTVPASTYRRMPWKNGGGETVEILTSPEGAALDAFDWRVSMARVDRPGPFSLFPGVDRTLTILDGAELVLHFADGGAIHLTADSAPHAFPADVPVTAGVSNGGIVDLNVMTRRGRVSHEVRRRIVERPITLSCDADQALCLLRGSGARATDGTQDLDMADGDALVLGPADRVIVTPRGRVTLFTALFRRV